MNAMMNCGGPGWLGLSIGLLLLVLMILGSMALIKYLFFSKQQ